MKKTKSRHPATKSRAKARRVPAKKGRHILRIGAIIAVLLLLIGAWLAVSKLDTQEDPKDVLAAVAVAASVGGPPPTQGATISSPHNGDTTESDTIQVTGTCQPVTFVVIQRNGVAAGSASCNGSQTFAINIQLLVGNNSLVAETYDFINQKGPDSDIVVIMRNAPSETPDPESVPVVSLAENQSGITAEAPGGPFILIMDTPFRRLGINEDVNWPIRAQGGTPPYVLDINWGGDSTDKAALPDTQLYTLHHSYAKPGIFRVEISGTDGKGQQTSLQATAAIATTQITNNENMGQKTVGAGFNWRLTLGIGTAVIVLIIVVWIGRRFILRV